MFVSAREALPEVCGALPDIREWSGDPPGCLGVIGRPSRMSARWREVLPNVREWSGGPHELS